MARNPLFSTYRQGENRVTSSMLAVFERIDLSLLETILSKASGESSLQMVRLTNQPVGEGASVPDARISARFAYWFEVKTTRGALRTDQLVEHLQNVSLDGDERLFVVTPDATFPGSVEELDDERVTWFNFTMISDAIDDTLDDPRELIAEQQRYLLREFQALMVEDGLLDTDDVVVVAARRAYRMYFEHCAYVCQPDRSFREGLTHMGFYADGAIQPLIARIEHQEASVPISREEAARRRGTGDPTDARVAQLMEEVLANGTHEEGEPHGIFLLSGPDDPGTKRLAAPIANDTLAASGRPWAWTMSQRYVRLKHLTDPDVKHTSDLETRARS